MLFNSWSFFAFFAIVLAVYNLLPGNRYKNPFLLLASYFFYGSWNWKFLSLILISTSIDYICARAIDSYTDKRKRRMFLTFSIISNLSILGFFKYFNFFSQSFSDLMNGIGLSTHPILLNIVLPVGISFYTFQSMAYTIDVYKGRVPAEKNAVNFALYVAFFPQLVAGPIERAKRLLTQIKSERPVSVEAIEEGVYLILFGLYKKVVIADNLAPIANVVFANPLSAADAWLGAVAFAVQIYCDFSGYTDIARGSAKLLGFNLTLNFNQPYFSVSPSDFWKRWHISLSSWLRDYLYIPLGGNKKGSVRTAINLMVVMILGGLWHGAAWNFVLWGTYHGLLLVIWHGFEGRLNLGRKVTKVNGILLTNLAVLYGWVLFRSPSLADLKAMTGSMFSSLSSSYLSHQILSDLLFFTIPLAVIDYFQYRSNDHLIIQKASNKWRIPLYSFFILQIILFGVSDYNEFIYFQF